MPTIPPDHEFVSPGQVAPDRPAPDACMVCGESRAVHYYRAAEQADADVREALAHVSAEQDAGRLTTRQAAGERIRLLENHLERCRQLRLEHLGGTP